MKNNKLDGSELINRFIYAVTNLSTAERARYIAEQKENLFYEQMNSLGTNNGVYLTPDAIPENEGNKLVKESFNAHLTKVQSDQIIQKTSQEILSLQEETLAQFKDKKVVVSIINTNSKPFDAVYIDNNSNSYRASEFKVKKLKGTIEDIVFEKNLLIIKPSFFSRKITPNRVLINVYVVDFQTLSPNVSITF